ncbi:NAD(P)H-hydrate epimerase [uncultured Amnibacterium sp.]|uniref:NAD(P)H-hydrate epimerase n=1 Tax=uncultured Amnibacterium sp. TaxID=1631851 RepID=UPI0035CC4C60
MASSLFTGYTADEVRAAERPLLDAGVPLMQRAAAALADELRSVLTLRGAGARRIVALVGPGDNGGDALFAVAALARQGCPVVLVPLGGRTHEAGLAAAMAAGADLMDAFVVTPERVASLAAEADVVVDGILGTGADVTAGLRSPAREVVAAILPVVAPQAFTGPVVVAVDLPSGIPPDGGRPIDGPVLPAAVTVTFGAVKAGLLDPSGAHLVGRIRLVDLGLQLPPRSIADRTVRGDDGSGTSAGVQAGLEP